MDLGCCSSDIGRLFCMYGDRAGCVLNLRGLGREGGYSLRQDLAV